MAEKSIMEFLQKPPRWLLDLVPESARDLLDHGGWWVVLGFAALVILLLAWAILARLGRLVLERRREAPPTTNLTENLAAFRPPANPGGPTQLNYEGLPVRLRLIVVAAAGKDFGFHPKNIVPLLDRVVVGLSEIAEDDRPRVRIWPAQHSYEGFSIAFHRSTPLPEGEGNPSQWIPVAGRAIVGKQPILLGLVLWSEEKTTLSRRTLEPPEWPVLLRIKRRGR
jgi:hypothetical protein